MITPHLLTVSLSFCLIIQKFDISRITVNDLEFESNFTLTVKQNGMCYVSHTLLQGLD